MNNSEKLRARFERIKQGIEAAEANKVLEITPEEQQEQLLAYVKQLEQESLSDVE